MTFNSLGFLAFFAAVCAALSLTNIPAVKRALGDKLFGARHVLLIGGTGALCACMQAMLTELGAKPARIPPSASSETLCRAMTAGRISAAIAPCAFRSPAVTGFSS